MSENVLSKEKLAKATRHDCGDIEYGVYMELYTGVSSPDNAREGDWRSMISQHRNLESALAAKASVSDRPFLRNLHVVQRTVSPWEVKEND